MSEESLECIICYDPEIGNSCISLSDEFGCECKGIVHKQCLSEWSKFAPLESSNVCILCKKNSKGRLENRQSVLQDSIIASYAPQLLIFQRERIRIENEELGLVNGRRRFLLGCMCPAAYCYFVICFCFLIIIIISLISVVFT